MSMNFFKKLRYVEIARHKNSELSGEHACAPAIRLYRDSPEGTTLQVRGPQRLAGRNKSKSHTIISSAHMTISEVLELRAAIDELLADFPDYAYKNAGIERVSR